MNPVEEAVLEALGEKPASGGKIIERLQAQGSDLVQGRAVVVYGALGNLAKEGKVKVIGEGPGERVFGLPGSPPAPPSPPGHPPSFGLGAAELALVEKEIAILTERLPPHYFEELRRAVVADADRRAFNGEKLPRAAASALADLGSPSGARGLLKDVEKGRTVRLGLRRRVALGWLVAPLCIIVMGVLAWKFVLGVYTLPPESISMAPTLIPGAEGGDAIVLADLLAYTFSGKPQRGDVVVFRLGPDRDHLVKRVMGIPGERLSFRRGDLFVNGKVLVKDRALLDRVKVPLLRLPDYKRTDTGWEPTHALTLGYRLPSGAFDGPALPAREAVVLARVRARASPSSIAFVLEDGVEKHTVLLETGIDSSVYVNGLEVDGVSRALLRLKPGMEREVWFTNADNSFRVEVDGRQAAPATTLRPGKEARVSIVVSGEVEILSLEVARDLVYESPDPDPLGPDEYFVLGDNSTRSLDSRAFKAIPRDAILGRVFAVAWPPSRARRIR